MQRQQKEAKDKDKGRTLKPAPPKRGIQDEGSSQKSTSFELLMLRELSFC